MTPNRILGVTVPLFSIRSERDWGIGEIPDLPSLAAWVGRANCKLIQLLPPHELAAGETSPYGARTAFGLDPIYIGMHDVPDFDSASVDRAEIAKLNGAARVDYARVRRNKHAAIGIAFDRFYEKEWQKGTARAKQLAGFIEAEKSWLDDFAIYVAIRESHNQYGWRDWPEGEKNRVREVIDQARRDHAKAILRVSYEQWIAFGQWGAARDVLRSMHVDLMGDLPFTVNQESADLWSHRNEFRSDVTLGAPPDSFAHDGQDWGLPAYAWSAIESMSFSWIRARTRHAIRLYDCFRLDHVVGFYRQWLKHPSERHGFFDPPDEPEQITRGERIMRAMLDEAGEGRIIAEDLGMVPPYVRQSLTRLRIPGYRVIPWEQDDGKFREPREYPELSVATWSTHDTDPITAWWDHFSDDERRQLASRAELRQDANESERTLILLKLLLESRSKLVLVLAQELLAERVRINTPGTVDAVNWTYRLPQMLEALARDARVGERFDFIRKLAEQAGR